MKITITPSMLCDLLPSFTLEACEVICEYFEEMAPDCCPSIGDIAICFGEIPTDWVEREGDDEYNIIAHLTNGNTLIAH